MDDDEATDATDATEGDGPQASESGAEDTDESGAQADTSESSGDGSEGFPSGIDTQELAPALACDLICTPLVACAFFDSDEECVLQCVSTYLFADDHEACIEPLQSANRCAADIESCDELSGLNLGAEDIPCHNEWSTMLESCRT